MLKSEIELIICQYPITITTFGGILPINTNNQKYQFYQRGLPNLSRDGLLELVGYWYLLVIGYWILKHIGNIS